MAETRMEHFARRRAVLERKRRIELEVLYRQMGGLSSVARWRKDEVVNAVVEMEWRRLPAADKKPDPPRLTPPCDECGGGQGVTAHRYGGDHHYTYLYNPETPWVPESEAEAERLAELGWTGEGDQLPDNIAELVDELSAPIITEDGQTIPPAIAPAELEETR